MQLLVSVITLLKEAQILFEGIGEAITPLISIYIGEECCPGVRNVWKLAVWSVRAESLLSTALLLVFAPSVIGLIGIITRFIFEELFMLIYDCNPGKKVHAECMVEMGESIRLITKDDGQIVDLLDTDQRVVSLRAYALSNMIESHTKRRVHSLALSFNHNALEIL